MKLKFDCPLDFLDNSTLENLLIQNHIEVDEKNPECLIVNPGTEFFLDRSYFQVFKNLKVVGTPSTGVNHIDIKYLESKNVKTFCLLDSKESLENIHASAEFTWIHIMNAFRKFNLSIKNVNNWRNKENEFFLRSNELAGKKIGIIGLGRIGRKIARYAEAFLMDIVYYDPYVENESYKKAEHFSELKDRDVISINCYLTEETRNMIKEPLLDEFNNDLIVINTSRGEVVDENYILKLLNENKIIYSCDVLQNEQKIESLRTSKLFNYKSDRLTITPHVAGATVESQYKALISIITLCQNYLKV